MAHITPGYNGWHPDAIRIINGINYSKNKKFIEEREIENARRRELAEIDYYEENHCFPRPMGYFGTETDAFLYEK